MSDTATIVKLTLRFKIPLVCLLRRVKDSKPNSFSIDTDGGRPPFTLALNSHQSRGLIGSGGALEVLQVGTSGNITKVSDGIVSLVSVDVVNVHFRPLAGHIKPGEAMRIVPCSLDSNDDVSDSLSGSGRTAFWGTKAKAFQPSEIARNWVVVKKFAQTLRGKIGLSHDALQLLIGQKPRSVSALPGLRYFKGAAA
jgi:hypothetical protein